MGPFFNKENANSLVISDSPCHNHFIRVKIIYLAENPPELDNKTKVEYEAFRFGRFGPWVLLLIRLRSRLRLRGTLRLLRLRLLRLRLLRLRRETAAGLGPPPRSRRPSPPYALISSVDSVRKRGALSMTREGRLPSTVGTTSSLMKRIARKKK